MSDTQDISRPVAPAARSSASAFPPRDGILLELWLWSPVLLVVGVIFGASSIPGLAAPQVSDKTAHVLAYGALAAAVVRALARAQWSRVTGATVALAILLATSYGVTDEIHQMFVPRRSAELADVAADLIGASAAAGALWAWSIIRRFRAR